MPTLIKKVKAFCQAEGRSTDELEQLGDYWVNADGDIIFYYNSWETEADEHPTVRPSVVVRHEKFPVTSEDYEDAYFDLALREEKNEHLLFTPSNEFFLPQAYLLACQRNPTLDEDFREELQQEDNGFYASTHYREGKSDWDEEFEGEHGVIKRPGYFPMSSVRVSKLLEVDFDIQQQGDYVALRLLNSYRVFHLADIRKGDDQKRPYQIIGELETAIVDKCRTDHTIPLRIDIHVVDDINFVFYFSHFEHEKYTIREKDCITYACYEFTGFSKHPDKDQ